jgi:hypothetical protein
VQANIRQPLRRRKRRIQRRLDRTDLDGCHRPLFTASDIHYEIAERARSISSGGIGAIHALARQVGLVGAIDRRLHLLKFHLPYHESDHVLPFAYNVLCDGTCLRDLELRRHDEVFRDARGARRIPDPTTAGDFCRRGAFSHGLGQGGGQTARWGQPVLPVPPDDLVERQQRGGLVQAPDAKEVHSPGYNQGGARPP